MVSVTCAHVMVDQVGVCQGTAAHNIMRLEGGDKKNLKIMGGGGGG